ncbi:MAG TPA: GPR endopeptidase [Bacillota bacterium]|nr:GPR endopeptidase [Bacillota bacterium]
MKITRTIRTDLAMESREMAQQGSQQEIPGVLVDNVRLKNINITRVEITSPTGEARIGKPIGNYITLEIPGIKDRDPEYEERVSKQLAEEIERLIKLDEKSTVLIVGLGNWNITPDAVGPKVVERLMVTRHIFEFVPDQVDERMRPVSAVSPGVLGITGVETGEVIHGLVEKIKPDLVIAVDALASRKTERIGSTIQIADTGINPGSGIGNKRMGISKETLGVPTLAIGIPTVVYAYTIGRDAIEMVLDQLRQDIEPGSQAEKLISSMDQEHVDKAIDAVLAEGLGDLVVTPKEVDVLIDDVCGMIANGINLAVHRGISLGEIKRFLH